jgi:hypothetical protein
MNTLTGSDFQRAVDNKKRVDAHERSFFATFVTPTLVACGQSSKGVNLFSYPSFESLGHIMFGRGYVTQIVHFPDTNIIAISNDSSSDGIGDVLEIFNFRTKELVWKNNGDFILNSRKMICVNETMICAAHVSNLSCFNFQTKETFVVPKPDNGTVERLLLVEKNLFLSACMTDRNRSILQLWKWNHTNIEQVWKLECEGLQLSSFQSCITISSSGILCQLYNKVLLLVSLKGEIVRTIENNTREVSKNSHKTVHLIDDRYLLSVTSYRMYAFDTETQKTVMQYMCDNESLIHSIALNTQQSVIVVASENTHMDVLRLREDVTVEQLRMIENLKNPLTGDFCDIGIKLL